MLRELRVQDFALVPRLELACAPGFTVFTGETGAGKSILIDAVEAVLGGRTGPEMVRSGAEQALIEATFTVAPGAPVTAYLEELGVPPDLEAEPGEAAYVLAREIARSGRSRCRVNGRTLTREQLFTVGSHLVNLHGQHEHQTLLQSAKQLALLDAFAGEEAAAARASVARLYERYRTLMREQESIELGEAQRVQRLDFLRYQLGEIKEANLSPGEEEELLRERQLLLQAEKLRTQLERAYGALYGGESGAGASDLLEEAQGALEELARIDPALEGLREAVQSAACQAAESARELAAYRERVDLDPERLDVLEERLDRISRLRRKYGARVEAILAYAEQAAAEVARLERADERAGELAAEVEAVRRELEEAAGVLSGLRRRAAAAL
ncbi:MAG: AAA family ATPase, partial [Chitinophagales bacterium]